MSNLHKNKKNTIGAGYWTGSGFSSYSIHITSYSLPVANHQCPGDDPTFLAMEHHLRCATYDLLTADRVAHSMWIVTTRSSTKNRKMIRWMEIHSKPGNDAVARGSHGMRLSSYIWNPQRWCAWTSPCTLVQCCDVEDTGTWSLQQRGREIDDEHHINLHQMFDLLAPPEMFRTVEWQGMGEEENALPLASCRWHGCVGAHFPHSWHIHWEIANPFSQSKQSMVRPSDWGVAWLSYNISQPEGNRFTLIIWLSHGFRVFLQKKPYSGNRKCAGVCGKVWTFWTLEGHFGLRLLFLGELVTPVIPFPTFHLRLMANHLETLPSTYGLEPQYDRRYGWW